MKQIAYGRVRRKMEGGYTAEHFIDATCLTDPQGKLKIMQDLKACMRYVFILSAMIIIGIFATDWWFTRDGDLLNDTLVGVMMGAPLGWFGAFVAFYTTEKVTQMQKKEEVADGNNPSESTDH